MHGCDVAKVNSIFPTIFMLVNYECLDSSYPIDYNTPGKSLLHVIHHVCFPFHHMFKSVRSTTTLCLPTQLTPIPNVGRAEISPASTIGPSRPSVLIY